MTDDNRANGGHTVTVNGHNYVRIAGALPYYICSHCRDGRQGDPRTYLTPICPKDTQHD